VLPLFADELKLNCKHGLIEGKKPINIYLAMNIKHQ